jgi:hypothetical protein
LTPQEKARLALVEKFWFRVQQKFKKAGDAFRHFDRNYDGSISFKEFRIVCEELDMRFSSSELGELYGYIDED